MTTPEIAESFLSTLNREHELRLNLRSSALSRLVWFVAIDAYALLNARSYWEAIAGKAVDGTSFLWLSLPWLSSAVLGVITHFVSHKLAFRQDSYSAMMIAAVDLLRIRSSGGKPDPDAFQALVHETDPRFEPEKRSIVRLERGVRRLELLTFLLLVLGFIWSVTGPRLLGN